MHRINTNDPNKLKFRNEIKTLEAQYGGKIFSLSNMYQNGEMEQAEYKAQTAMLKLELEQKRNAISKKYDPRNNEINTFTSQIKEKEQGSKEQPKPLTIA